MNSGHLAVIRNVRVVQNGDIHGPVDIWFRDGIILAWTPPGHFRRWKHCIPPAGEYDGSGKFLLPGVLDLHVHLRDPHFASTWHLSAVHQEVLLLLQGGTTALGDMPNTEPPVVDVHTFDQKWKRFQEHCPGVLWTLFPAITDDNWQESTSWIREDPRVLAIKIFLAPSTGDLWLQDVHLLPEILRKVPVPVLIHAELPAWFTGNSPPLHPPDYPRWRTKTACIHAFREVVRAVEQIPHARVHILHLTTAEEIELYQRLPGALRRRLTLETCPHYLMRTDKDYYRLGSRLWCNPAIKFSEDRIRLREGLIQHCIFTVGSDHAPHPADTKMTPPEARAGLPGGPFLLASLLYGVDCGWWRLEDVVYWTAHHPARLLGVADQIGWISPGFMANAVLIGRGHPAFSRNSFPWGWHPYPDLVEGWQIEEVFVQGIPVLQSLREKRNLPAGIPLMRKNEPPEKPKTYKLT